MNDDFINDLEQATKIKAMLSAILPCDHHTKALTDIRVAIWGNGDGKPGMKSMVEGNTEYINTIKRWTGVLMTCAIGGGLSAICTFVLIVMRLALKQGVI